MGSLSDQYWAKYFLITFISDPNVEVKSTLKLTDDTKMSGKVDTPEDKVTLQEHLNRLKEWASKNLIKFYDKCRVLLLEYITPEGCSGWNPPGRRAALWKGT